MIRSFKVFGISSLVVVCILLSADGLTHRIPHQHSHRLHPHQQSQ